MEGLEISGLVEDILSGRLEDPKEHKSMIQILHQQLLKNHNLAKSAINVLQKTKSRLQVCDFNLMLDYFSSMLKGNKPRIPKLGHLIITTPSAVKAIKLANALNTLELKKNSNAFSSFFKIKENSWRFEYRSVIKMLKLEEKRQNCEKIVNNLKYCLGLNMQKTIDK